MDTPIATVFFDLVEEVHDPTNPKYGYKSFSTAMGIPHRTFMRWKKKIETGDDKNVPVTIDMVIGLATINGMTCRDIMVKLGREEFFDEKPARLRLKHYDINQFSQVVFSLKNRYSQRALESALDGRQAHSLGQLEQAARDFASGIKSVQAGEQPLFEAYLRLLYGNTIRMLGKVDEAREQFRKAKQLAEEYTKQLDVSTERDLELEVAQANARFSNLEHISPPAQKHIAARMLAERANIFLIILNWWRGDMDNVISEAQDLIGLLEDEVKDFGFIPNLYYFLGRTYWNIGKYDYALFYANKGLDEAFALDAKHYAERAFFLDYPPDEGYQWRVVHLSQLILDIQIATGDLEGAKETYLSISQTIPRNAATLWSTHAWFFPEWQEYIKGKPDLQRQHFRYWRKEIAKSGNFHSLAINQYHYARTVRSQKQLKRAAVLLSDAMQMALKVQASFSAAMCGIELINVCAERQAPNDKQLALNTLSMVQGIVDTLDNRYLKQQFACACEVVQSIE